MMNRVCVLNCHGLSMLSLSPHVGYQAYSQAAKPHSRAVSEAQCTLKDAAAVPHVGQVILFEACNARRTWPASAV
jgi:hypothetical protein